MSTTTAINEIARKTIERRAIEAAIWATPIVSFHAMREAVFRDAGIGYNDIVYLSKPAGWKFQTPTPGNTMNYMQLNINTTDGPVVFEIPAEIEAGLFGGMLDAWQAPFVDIGPEGPDAGKGGKYLVLPPHYDGEIPEGYFVSEVETYNSYGLFRFTPRSGSAEDLAATISMMKKVRVYPLSEAANPPEQRFVDMADELFDGVMTFDETYFDALAQMINEEPVLDQDKTMMGLLLTLGIKKGQPFEPSAELRTVLAKAAQDAHAFLMDGAEKYVTPFWENSTWNIPIVGAAIQTEMSFRFPDYLDTDARAIQYFQVYGGVKSVAKRAGKGVPSTFYQTAFRDADGELLRGEATYSLRVPADCPVNLFWSMTVYDLVTCCFIRDVPRTGLDDYDPNIEKNDDGSVTVYFGPESPAGKEGNWIPTLAGRPWFPFFRAYGPKASILDKKWVLPAIERVKG